MFQSFDASARPDQGPPRLAALRKVIAAEGLDGFVVPRADAHQGEYVPARDERLRWLTGFTGSAGFCVVLGDRAGVFVDGRYRVQVRAQVAGEFTPVPWPETKLADWLLDTLGQGRIGFDPWLHTAGEIETARKTLGDAIELVPCANLIDRIWSDQPAPPRGKAFAHPIEITGLSAQDKLADMAAILSRDQQSCAVLTLPDSISWLLNIRGRDLPNTPVVLSFAILRADASLDLFCEPGKLDDLALGPGIRLHAPSDFAPALAALTGRVRIDKTTAPLAISHLVQSGGGMPEWGGDPCILAKARKSPAEIAATREAHLRDGAAMVEFLSWLDAEAAKLDADPTYLLHEIDVVTRLESIRRATNMLHGISFDTICGSGPNGAIMHYRVTDQTNRRIQPGELLVVDSGGQYIDGTTDITRTIAIGEPGEDECAAFTRVLQGMIAISRARWPRGLAGRDLDPLARAALWAAGQDYDHGTGHGVGVFMNVHEGPQRLSRISEVPFEPGMILSNEPGYYREGAFGIRIENLIVVQQAPGLGDGRDQLNFETLTYVPIDLALVEAEVLSQAERDWLNEYHATTRALLSDRVSAPARDWLAAATRPI